MLELNLYFAIGETQVQKKCSDASRITVSKSQSKTRIQGFIFSCNPHPTNSHCPLLPQLTIDMVVYCT